MYVCMHVHFGSSLVLIRREGMALTKAREFKTRFGASSLHLQTCEDLEQRKIRSAECKNSLLGVLGGSALSDVEKRDITTLLVDDPRRQW